MSETTHDPGPDAASDRRRRLPRHRGVAPADRRQRHDPHRHGVLDRPDDDRGRRVLPGGADSAEERLNYYASRFPVVEVDATYYALPVRRTAELWVERTPPDFVFDIKAHALMTGQPTETKRLPKDLRSRCPPRSPRSSASTPRTSRTRRDDVWAWFADGLEPLKEAGQLGSILLQYPALVLHLVGEPRRDRGPSNAFGRSG